MSKNVPTEEQLRKSVLAMADVLGEGMPGAPADELAGFLVGSLGDRTTDQKLYMLSTSYVVALKMLHELLHPLGVQNLNTPPTEEEKP